MKHLSAGRLQVKYYLRLKRNRWSRTALCHIFPGIAMGSISTGTGMGAGVETVNVNHPASPFAALRAAALFAQNDNGLRCWASSAIMANSVITLGGSISPLSSR